MRIMRSRSISPARTRFAIAKRAAPKSWCRRHRDGRSFTSFAATRSSLWIVRSRASRPAISRSLRGTSCIRFPSSKSGVYKWASRCFICVTTTSSPSRPTARRRFHRTLRDAFRCSPFPTSTRSQRSSQLTLPPVRFAIDFAEPRAYFELDVGSAAEALARSDYAMRNCRLQMRGSLVQGMRIQGTAALFSISLALGFAAPAQADDRPAAPASGFYGGVSLRDRAQEGLGLTIGNASSVWNRFATPTIDDTSARTLVFGGYRFRNDIAVEASFNAIDKYSLKPADSISGVPGVGLNFGTGSGFAEPPSRIWNLDVYTSWTFYRAFALYGRLGYAQSD